jgi:hypothetical protein
MYQLRFTFPDFVARIAIMRTDRMIDRFLAIWHIWIVVGDYKAFHFTISFNSALIRFAASPRHDRAFDRKYKTTDFALSL